ncbi:hypothetical protein F5884DRAFT_808749 [Xylogone sp. PMI_703]|nr:hypothetical protein F5884DRAFT_808749 [Xylogone sp. PMI_703]
MSFSFSTLSAILVAVAAQFAGTVFLVDFNERQKVIMNGCIRRVTDIQNFEDEDEKNSWMNSRVPTAAELTGGGFDGENPDDFRVDYVFFEVGGSHPMYLLEKLKRSYGEDPAVHFPKLHSWLLQNQNGRDDKVGKIR